MWTDASLPVGCDDRVRDRSADTTASVATCQAWAMSDSARSSAAPADPGADPSSATDPVPAPSDLAEAIAADPGRCLLATDFDGVLAPIVDNPEVATIHPSAREALVRWVALVGQVAIITGRPARTAVRLGALASDELRRLVVLGQYGVERWDGATDEYHDPDAPAQLIELRQRLPQVLGAAGWPGATVEDKGRALAVHTRRLSDPAAAFAALQEPVDQLAQELGLHLEPGKNVLEVRPSGMDKGQALRAMADEIGARSVIYIGDDRGDLPAFAEVRALADGSRTTCGVWAASAEQPHLPGVADVVVEGPGGVATWLHDLADQVSQLR